VPPARIARYDVLKRLATGGMAEIFLCALRGPSRFERLVVVKRILPHLLDTDPRFSTMFVDEARNLARIAHPNVVHVHDFGVDGAEPYLAMEYVEGETLATLARRLDALHENLDPRLGAFIVAEACAGLHSAHELVGEDGEALGLVHRDISPQNVIVTYDGHLKVLDFGIAFTSDRMARTDTGEVKGKLHYMSPEQLRGERLDRRSDVFSIGIVLYELVTGRRLYDRPGHGPVVDAILNEPPVPPSRLVDDCPPELDAACARALEKRKEDRYPTAMDMRRDLLEVVRGLVDPTAALSSAMRRLFAERIQEKTRFVAELRGGEPTTPAAVDDALLSTIAVTPLGPEPRRRLAAAFSMGAAGLIVLAAVAWGASRVRAVEAPAAASTVPDAAAPVASSVDPPSRPHVTVAVRTTPPGARVTVDGEAKGETPLDLAVPRGSAPVVVVVQRASFEPIREAVVPDRDQSLVLSLLPSAKPPRSPTRAPARAPSAPRSSTSGFVRFE
jgi:serine/threonine-protein kinase